MAFVLSFVRIVCWNQSRYVLILLNPSSLCSGVMFFPADLDCHYIELEIIGKDVKVGKRKRLRIDRKL